MNPIEDELALRNLMGRYTDAVNRRDADAWIATWAEDGVWRETIGRGGQEISKERANRAQRDRELHAVPIAL